MISKEIILNGVVYHVEIEEIDQHHFWSQQIAVARSFAKTHAVCHYPLLQRLADPIPVCNHTISMLECVSIAKKHIENNIAKNSSGTRDIDNQAKLLNRIAEYAVLIFINRNYYKQFIITCEDEVMHYNKPLGTIIKQGIGLGEIDQSIHAEALKHARQLINQLIG